MQTTYRSFYATWLDWVPHYLHTQTYTCTCNCCQYRRGIYVVESHVQKDSNHGSRISSTSLMSSSPITLQSTSLLFTVSVPRWSIMFYSLGLTGLIVDLSVSRDSLSKTTSVEAIHSLDFGPSRCQRHAIKIQEVKTTYGHSRSTFM